LLGVCERPGTNFVLVRITVAAPAGAIRHYRGAPLVTPPFDPAAVAFRSNRMSLMLGP